MGKTFRKITALFITLCMILTVSSAAMAASEYAVKINGVTLDEAAGTVTAAQLTVRTAGSYTTYAAVYEDNALVGVTSDTETLEKGDSVTAAFEDAIEFDPDSQTLRVYVWNSSLRAVAAAYTYDEPTDDDGGEEVTEAFTASFVTDGHVTVNVSTTQSFDESAYVTEDASEAYARSSATGEIDTTGEGQVNFKVVVDEGYEIDAVTVTPAENYKNLKVTGDEYRITKITGDVTVSIATKEQTTGGEEEPITDDGSERDTERGLITLSSDGITSTVDEQYATVSEDGKTVTIIYSGTYNITGSISGGQIAVADPAAKVVINLDNVTIDNSASTLTPFYAESAKVTLSCTGTISFTDSENNKKKACVYSQKDLEIQSADENDKATVTVTANRSNGIRSEKDLEIGSVNLIVTSVNNGVKGDKSVKLTKKAGDITIVTTGDGDGIKSDLLPSIDADTGEYVTGGTVTINGGNINITTGSATDETTGEVSTGDGIQADTLLEIKGGTIEIDAAGEALKANASNVEDGTPEEGDGSVKISGGTITAKSGEDGVKAIRYFEMSGGNVTIDAELDGIQAGKAYTALDLGTGTDDETVLYETNGVVNITGGTLDVTAQGGATDDIVDRDGNETKKDFSCKGIKARKLIDISCGTITVDSYDDAIHSNHTANISGGTITVRSCDDGVHGEYFLNISDDAYINVTKSYEGIEASEIYITGGETYVVAVDDGANAAGDEPTDDALTLDTVYSSAVTTSSVSLMAGPSNQGGWNGGPGMNDDSATYGYLEVSGGLLYIEAEGDGFDSNGSGLISDGTVLVNGPTSGGNGVFDIGDSSGDTLTVTGGTVIGAGTSDMAVTPTSATGSQAYVVTTVSTQSAGKAIQVLSGSNEIVTYIPSKNYAWIFVSTPSISSGTSYTVKYGGAASDGTWAENYKETYGIKTGATFSGGSSASVTAVTGGSSSGGGQGGNDPGQGGSGQGGPGGNRP